MNFLDLSDDKKKVVEEGAKKLMDYVKEESAFINKMFTDTYGEDWEKITPEQYLKINFSNLVKLVSGKLCPFLNNSCQLDNCLCFSSNVRHCATDGLVAFECSKNCFRESFSVPSEFQRRCMEYSRMTPEEMINKFVEAYAFPKDADALINGIINSCEYDEAKEAGSYLGQARSTAKAARRSNSLQSVVSNLR